jgi:hypothetical protein
MNENIKPVEKFTIAESFFLGVVAGLAVIGLTFLLMTACDGWGKTPTKEVAPIETIDDYPCVVVDTDCVAHRISSRHLSNLHHGLYIEDVEGHSLCVFADGNGIASFIHITPCKRCAEEEFHKTHKLEPTKFKLGSL